MKTYKQMNKDNKTVMTLDAGGTNFVFSAFCDGKELVTPVRLPAHADNLDLCLGSLVEGFTRVGRMLPEPAVAISFAFPGPADYVNGVIGDLPNFPSFRGGIALGSFLEDKFSMPVFINNDGNLFAYGEAMGGMLPQMNAELEQAGSSRRYHNLLGVTLGTGFGSGVVLDGRLLLGDNGCGGDVWLMRNARYNDMIAEEGVSIRAVKRVYAERSGEDAAQLTPKDIFDIAEGTRPGNPKAAADSFEELGHTAGAAIANALDIVDGLVVIGGGLAGAHKYFLRALVQELNQTLGTFAGQSFSSLQSAAYNLEDDGDRKRFLVDGGEQVQVPGTDRRVCYHKDKKIGVAISRLGASKSVNLGAYYYAINNINS